MTRKLGLEALENKDQPSASILGDGVLYVHPATAPKAASQYFASVSQVGSELIVTEGWKGHHVAHTFDVADVKAIWLRGDRNHSNTLINKTVVGCLLTGGIKSDRLTVTSGYNILQPDRGKDALIVNGGSGKIETHDKTKDTILFQPSVDRTAFQIDADKGDRIV
jgi:hypothetical protein